MVDKSHSCSGVKCAWFARPRGASWTVQGVNSGTNLKEHNPLIKEWFGWTNMCGDKHTCSEENIPNILQHFVWSNWKTTCRICDHCQTTPFAIKQQTTLKSKHLSDNHKLENTIVNLLFHEDSTRSAVCTSSLLFSQLEAVTCWPNAFQRLEVTAKLSPTRCARVMRVEHIKSATAKSANENSVRLLKLQLGRAPSNGWNTAWKAQLHVTVNSRRGIEFFWNATVQKTKPAVLNQAVCKNEAVFKKWWLWSCLSAETHAHGQL